MMTEAADSSAATEAAEIPGPAQRLSIRKKLLFLIVPVFVLIAVGEMSVRLIAPRFAHMRFSRELTGGYPIARRGADYRGGEEIVEPKAPDEIRLALFGDSVMWGYSLPIEKSVPVLVEAKLNANGAGPRFRCINMAGMGRMPTLTRDWFLERLGSWQIDAVIYQFHLNDLAWPEKKTRGVEKQRSAPSVFDHYGREIRGRYLRYSALFAFLEERIRQFGYWWHRSDDPAIRGMAACCDSEEIRERWETQFGALAEMKEACDRLGIGFRVYLFPVTESLSDDPRDNNKYYARSKFTVDPYARFDEYCAKYGLSSRHLLDTIKSKREAMLAGEQPYNRLYCPYDDNHPNQTGADIFAEEIVRDVLSKKVPGVEIPG